MRTIINPFGDKEYIISEEEKTIFDIALRNLAIKTLPLAHVRGEEHD